MADREVDGFLIWAEANQKGDEAAVAYVLTKDTNGKVSTKRFNVITTETFNSMEAAHAAAYKVVHGISSVSATGVPTPLFY